MPLFHRGAAGRRNGLRAAEGLAAKTPSVECWHDVASRRFRATSLGRVLGSFGGERSLDAEDELGETLGDTAMRFRVRVELVW